MLNLLIHKAGRGKDINEELLLKSIGTTEALKVLKAGELAIAFIFEASNFAGRHDKTEDKPIETAGSEAIAVQELPYLTTLDRSARLSEELQTILVRAGLV